MSRKIDREQGEASVSQPTPHSVQTPHLVKMANQIALNFSAAGEADEAVEQTGVHIRKFWTAAMKSKLKAYVQAGGEGCSSLVLRVAVEQI